MATYAVRRSFPRAASAGGRLRLPVLASVSRGGNPNGTGKSEKEKKDQTRMQTIFLFCRVPFSVAGHAAGIAQTQQREHAGQQRGVAWRCARVSQCYSPLSSLAAVSSVALSASPTTSLPDFTPAASA